MSLITFVFSAFLNSLLVLDKICLILSVLQNSSHIVAILREMLSIAYPFLYSAINLFCLISIGCMIYYGSDPAILVAAVPLVRGSDNRFDRSVFKKWVYLASSIQPMFNIDVTDSISRKSVQDLLIPLIHIAVMVGYKPSSPLVGVLSVYLSFLSSLINSSGVAGCCLYLNTCFIVLQQAVSGYTPDNTTMNPRVSLSGGFLPAIIPIQHSCRISNNDAKVIQLWLSLFSIYSTLEYPGTLNLSTIINPCTNQESMESQVEELEPIIPWFYEVFGLPRQVGQVPKSGIVVYPNDNLEDETYPVANPYIISKSSPHTDQTRPDFVTASAQGAIRLAAAKLWSSSVWEYFEGFVPRFSSQTGIDIVQQINSYNFGPPDKMDDSLGKLGKKQEPAGNISIFAMVDIWTQWAMLPLHNLLFRIFSNVPMDGTFNQLNAVNRLVDYKYSRYFSYDLTAATDRLPVFLQENLLVPLLGSQRATDWRVILTGRYYGVGVGRLNNTKWISYSVGQPMGALSSWAMLALTHHFIIQASWYLCGGRHLFIDYGVLGDDVVLCNKKVSRRYLRIMDSLGLQINLSNSLVSSFALEFAKNFFWHGWDLSPNVLNDLNGLRSTMSSLPNFGLSHSLGLPQLLSLIGAGYKLLGSYHNRSLLSFTPNYKVAMILWMYDKNNLWFWMCSRSLKTAYLPTVEISNDILLTVVIPLYVRLIRESYSAFELNAGNAYESVLITPIDLMLGRSLIMDEIERVNDDLELVQACCSVTPFRDLWASTKNFNLVLAALQMVLEVGSSLPQLNGMYSRTEPDIEKAVFSQSVAIWETVNTQIRNSRCGFVNNPDWVINPEVKDTDPWSSVLLIFLWVWTGLCLIAIGWEAFSFTPLGPLQSESTPSVVEIAINEADWSWWFAVPVLISILTIFVLSYHFSGSSSTDGTIPLILGSVDLHDQVSLSELLDIPRPITYYVPPTGGQSPQMAHGYWEPYDPGIW